MNIRGLVLAGGKSSRFGEDKALAFYNGRSFLERAVSLLASLDLEPIIVTRRGANYPLTGCAVIYDKLSDKGPLGGLYTAMTTFKNSSFLVLPCDMPALVPAVLSNLLAVHEPHFGVTAYSVESGIQPFPAIYESSLLGIIGNKLEENNLSMLDLLDRVPAKKVMSWKNEQEIFCNINHKSDLTAGEGSLSHQ